MHPAFGTKNTQRPATRPHPHSTLPSVPTPKTTNLPLVSHDQHTPSSPPQHQPSKTHEHRHVDAPRPLEPWHMLPHARTHARTHAHQPPSCIHTHIYIHTNIRKHARHPIHRDPRSPVPTQPPSQPNQTKPNRQPAQRTHRLPQKSPPRHPARPATKRNIQGSKVPITVQHSAGAKPQYPTAARARQDKTPGPHQHALQR